VNRPAGVSLLALLMFCYGVLLAVQVAQLTQPYPELSYINTHLQHLLPGDRTDTVGVLYFSGTGALIALLIAGGLWFLKDPARWGLLMVAGFPVGRGLFQAAAIFATDSGRVWTAMGELFWFELFAYALLVLYLFRTDVQIAFGQHDRYASAFDPGEKETREHNYHREQ
jgi:hypothetical protein